MIILAGSSRAGGLQSGLPDVSETICISGGRISVVTEEVVASLSHKNTTNQTIQVYIMAGLCDFTRKIKNYRQNYTECVFDSDPEEAITRVISAFNKCIQDIQNAGATPVLCTITSANIAQYNLELLHQRWTRHLEYSKDYDSMQIKLNQTIDAINNYITATNHNAGLSTPHTHSAIKKRCGNGRRARYRYNWKGLLDGVHADSDTKIKWAQSIQSAIRRNFPHTLH